MNGANRAVFLDLNGTIVLPLKQQSLSELSLIPDADRAVRSLQDFGFACPVVTVQARIEKGLLRHWGQSAGCSGSGRLLRHRLFGSNGLANHR
jgi:histidinol phosphatase-like enzyme